MLDWADLVLAMDSAVLAELRKLAGDCARPELRLYADGRDAPDPWGKDEDAFNACAQLIEEAARQQAP
jgi:protein-tyrosine phosphatase